MPQKKAPLRRRFRWWVSKRYWNVVKHFNRLAYLKNLLDKAYDASDYQEEIDEVLTTETDIWNKRASKVHVSVADIPLPEGYKSHWGEGMTGPYIKWDSLRKLKKLVEDAEYERKRRKREGREL